ncbi:CRISPR-associated protein Csb2 [Austwickia chelonae]|uniref:CRISPR-associated protein n=1 Tax=Austwickia chelonae NBRC 105200 TaxID=1184607 RepID=K6VQ72_9MICO|nr:type I-U CRISPR-associated protein Csb2 [Austwickia chelonae]GAB78904.1 hypothetical protein AUCHE_17_01160 [Austwickia chelonae NBRC 105200]SEV86227.1 CRISPR-associated protein Csb2 [Austwickia chelonae]
MRHLSLVLTFPAGFHAHDTRGNPEWPPHPSRIAAAILSAAYTGRPGPGTPERVRVARALFELAPPTLLVPAATPRDTPFSRWVPVDSPVEVVGTKINTDRCGIFGKLGKPPERGTYLDAGAAVVVDWPTSLPEADLPVLDEVLADVTYLGRPTSPVVIDRHPSAPADANPEASLDALGQQYAAVARWEPDPHGRELLGIATPAYLNALDARERERDLFGVTGYHPQLSNRPTTAYRCTPLAAPGNLTCQLATTAQFEAATATLMFWRTPHAAPGDIGNVLDALDIGPGTATDRGALAIPVYGATTTRGLETARLFGVLTRAVPATPREFLLGRDMIDLLDVRPGAPSVGAKRAVQRAWATASAWTTTAPVTGTRDELLEELDRLAESAGAQIIDAQTHDISRDPHGPDVSTHPGRSHLSILFETPVPGPLALHGVALHPIPPGQ